MSEYSAEEYTDMIIVFGIAGENARAAVRLYAERFPERERHPDNNVILRCIRHARETETFLLNRRNVGVPVHRVAERKDYESIRGKLPKQRAPCSWDARSLAIRGASCSTSERNASVSSPASTATFTERPRTARLFLSRVSCAVSAE